MTKNWQKFALCFVAGSLPVLLFAFSTGPFPNRTGAPVDDDGLTCTACHRDNGPANSDPRGRVMIQAAPFRPGQKQVVRVTVEHPEAQRWGLEITARWVSDQNKQAGTFTPSESIRVVCGDSSAPPCAGKKEFATHTAAATAPGTNGGRTFEVEWTPPEGSEMGDIIFYAAGNAANNNNTNTGDRIYTTNLRIQPDPAGCSLTRRPQLRTVGNAASFQPPMSMNGLITLMGSDFQMPGVQREAALGDIRDDRFPTTLGCIAVEVNGQRVPITFIRPDQINAQVPTTSATGNVQVRVIANPDRPNQLVSDVATINLQAHAPAFFTFNGRSVAARHPDFSIAADPAVVTGGRPVRPGDVVILYATGLGATDPVYQAGEIVPRAVPLRDRVSVTMGGTTLQPADILYAGSAPTLVSGAYQLNLRVPASAATGDLPVSMTIGGVGSPAGTTIPVRAQP